jgi:hypothetical protein
MPNCNYGKVLKLAFFLAVSALRGDSVGRRKYNHSSWPKEMLDGLLDGFMEE